MKILPSLLSILILSAIASAAPFPNDGKPHHFEARGKQFLIDNQPIQLIAGELHPARIPFQFWEDRIKKARAMGLNTISFYVFWNQLEPDEGKFNFEGNNDLRRFVQLCQENGLWVIMHPGPYACAETEFGGYPAWLLKHHDLKIRTDDQAFLEYNRRYMKMLHDQLGDLQVTHGGPILMVQVENELGKINKYLADLKQIFIETGFDTQLFTCDHSGGVWNTIDGLPNILRATNGLPNQQKLTLAEAVAGDYPIYGSEVYTAWFSVWGGRVGGPGSKAKTIDKQLADTQWLLDRHLSFCYYVFDGGTNFGFSNGAQEWQPVQTTYDYDAPVDELGRVRPKFKALRDLFIKELKIDPPPIPADPAVIDIPNFTLHPAGALLDSLPKNPFVSRDVVTMEDLDQAYGCIDYQKHFNSLTGQLDLKKALDYSIVMIDGRPIGQPAFAGFGADSFKIKLNHSGSCMLDILVYNLGRNSVGINQSSSRKGLNDNPTLDGKPLQDWNIYSLPLASPSHATPGDKSTDAPTFYTTTFNLNQTGETYLDMRNWNFGVVWVNGHNLGRYWNVGADRGLYLPSVWQRTGTNQVTVLELQGPPVHPEISGVKNLVEESPKPFSPTTSKTR